MVVIVEASSRVDSSRGSSDCEYCECEIAISDGSDGDARGDRSDGDVRGDGSDIDDARGDGSDGDDARGDGVWGMCFVLRITSFCLVLGAGVGI